VVCSETGNSPFDSFRIIKPLEDLLMALSAKDAPWSRGRLPEQQGHARNGRTQNAIDHETGFGASTGDCDLHIRIHRPDSEHLP
jgi:hypothetical protein